jgi:hypothetical protein
MAQRFGISYLMGVVSRGDPAKSLNQQNVNGRRKRVPLHYQDNIEIVDEISNYCSKIATTTGNQLKCQNPEEISRATKLLTDCPQKIYHLWRADENEEEGILQLGNFDAYS